MYSTLANGGFHARVLSGYFTLCNLTGRASILVHMYVCIHMYSTLRSLPYVTNRPPSVSIRHHATAVVAEPQLGKKAEVVFCYLFEAAAESLNQNHR